MQALNIDSFPSLNLLDLELFHNFTTATLATLCVDSACRNTWKNAIARRATGSYFVMRALLSVSAAHMTKQKPERKNHHISYAIANHDDTSRQVSSIMTQIHSENLEDLIDVE